MCFETIFLQADVNTLLDIREAMMRVCRIPISDGEDDEHDDDDPMTGESAIVTAAPATSPMTPVATGKRAVEPSRSAMVATSSKRLKCSEDGWPIDSSDESDAIADGHVGLFARSSISAGIANARSLSDSSTSAVRLRRQTSTLDLLGEAEEAAEYHSQGGNGAGLARTRRRKREALRIRRGNWQPSRSARSSSRHTPPSPTFGAGREGNGHCLCNWRTLVVRTIGRSSLMCLPMLSRMTWTRMR